MQSLFNQAIINLNELINIRIRMSTIYSQLEKSKDSVAMQFKIKNYYKWIETLNNLINQNIIIKTKEDIKNLKQSKSLEDKLIELFNNGEITDLENAKTDLAGLEKLVETVDSLNNSCISLENGGENDLECETIIKSPTSKQQLKKNDLHTKQNDSHEKTQSTTYLNSIESTQIDTTLIESIPKGLADVKRPTDKIGAAAYDLNIVHGIGSKSANTFAKDGLTLELLLNDWNEYVKKDPITNSILMFSKMVIPEGYGKKQWDKIDDSRKRGILTAELDKRLKLETKYLHKLTNQQLLGLKYFYDITQKIPRDEVEKIEKILKKVATRMNPDIKVMLCGSYRRGRPRCGDIDCLITHPDIKTKEDLETAETNILDKFVKILIDINFIIDNLTDFGKSKYMGFCIINQQGRKPNIARRIDIKFIPYNSYGAAILYFTGSKNYNTLMRNFAKNKGYTLNEYGILRNSDDVFFQCPDEKDAFKILGYPYKNPEDRDI